MRLIGYILVTVGFLGGALFSVSDPQEIEWAWFGVSLSVGTGGMFVIRMTGSRRARAQGRVTSNIEIIRGRLEAIVGNISRLNQQKHSIDTYNIRHDIDELFADDLAGFVDARESIIHAYGLGAYGEVMSSFAAAERYLNRAWSASADGYVDEVNLFLDRAAEQFETSLARIQQLKRGAESGQAPAEA